MSKDAWFVRPDGWSGVNIELDSEDRPVRVHAHPDSMRFDRDKRYKYTIATLESDISERFGEILKIGNFSKEMEDGDRVAPIYRGLAAAVASSVKSNPVRHNKTNIALPPEVVEELFNWHGGQGSKVYSLASTGMRNTVSISMIENAISELVMEKPRAPKDRKDLKRLIGALETIVAFPEEYSYEG